jgi:hypothetical protein
MNNIVLAASDNLRLVFDHRGDRWGHRIEFDRNGEWVVAFSSIEGTATDDWPPSPALQHIHLQTFSLSGPTALLVGKAGASHWSAAIEADREAGVLRFDIACRLSSGPKYLGSTYSIIKDRTESAPRRPRIEVAMINDACLRAIQASETEMSVCVTSESLPEPRTIRWKYVVNAS